MPLRRFRDRLAKSDRRQRRIQYEIVTILNEFERRTQVQFALPTQYDFVQCRIVFQLDGRIFCFGNVQYVRHFLRVRVARRLDRKTVHRPRQLDRLQVKVIFVMGVMQYRVIVHLIDTRNRENLARHDLWNRNVFLAIQLQQLTDFDRFTCVADE